MTSQQNTSAARAVEARASRGSRSVLVVSALPVAMAIAMGLSSCKRETESGTGAASASAAHSAAPGAAPQASAPERPKGYPLGSTATIGYPLEILPGKGLGPIRFGATVETVQRHMTKPCDVLTETRCLYVNQAVDFTLKNGVVSEIYVVRRDRPAPPAADGSARYFGTFLGGMSGGFALGLYRHVVDQELRKPDRVEELPEPDQNGTVARYYYDGLVLDFDRIDKGVVVGAARITPSETATNPVKAAQSSGTPQSAPAPSAAAPSAPAPKK